MSLERNPRVATFPETADYFLRVLGTVIPFPIANTNMEGPNL